MIFFNYIASDLSDGEPEVWELEGEEMGDFIADAPSDIEVNSTATSEYNRSLALSKWIVYFLMLMYTKFKLSDKVFSFFLKFLKVLLSILGSYSDICAGIAESLPSSLYGVRTLHNCPKFTKFVACKKCHCLYYLKDCQEGQHNHKRSKLCAFIQYPNHTQLRMRKPCGATLLKTVELAGGRTFLYPYMTYCYFSLESSMQMLLDKPDFFSNCEQWRNRQASTEVLQDIYDGKIWREFQSYKGKPFLSESGNYALMLNLDFFQPYKHVAYSVGVIYMTVMNLPRNLRNKQENVILVGIIPGPHEPHHDLNTYLKPLVSDLLKFWHGVELNVPCLNSTKKISCALLCVSCDLPAGRKVCGFLSHSAHMGCHRCLKKFVGGVGSMDYSGFDRDKWKLRSTDEHKQVASKLRTAKTRAARDVIESTTGYRDTKLLQLPYFDAARMLVVDPMHNLFLGSSKHYMKAIFIEDGFITKDKFDLIQRRVDACIIPPDMGRILHKISSSFGSFTADQWKNWVVYFSPLVLHDILAEDVMNCWKHFVLACRLLSSKWITSTDLKIADALLMQFCRRTERMFGKEKITPNMHMHCHLKACIEDYGPSHVFWLYAFERYNGILGSMPNNNKSIETQLMQRFLEESQILSVQIPQEYSEQFVPILPTSTDTGSLLQPPSTLQHIRNEDNWTVSSVVHQISMPKYCSRHTLSTSQKEGIIKLYAEIYSISEAFISISSLYKKHTHAFMHGKQLGSLKSRTASSSLVFMSLKELNDDNIRVAQINYFCQHSATINGNLKLHLLVNLSWLKSHPKSSEFKPVSVWYHDLFESGVNFDFVPIQLVQSRSVSIMEKLDGESVLYVIPVIDF